MMTILKIISVIVIIIAILLLTRIFDNKIIRYILQIGPLAIGIILYIYMYIKTKNIPATANQRDAVMAIFISYALMGAGIILNLTYGLYKLMKDKEEGKK